MKHIFNPFHATAILILATALMTGCGGPKTGRIGEGNVTYEDAEAVETVTIDYGSTDLQHSAEFMTQSLLSSQWVADASSPPRIRLRQVQNMTDEHIDTKGITDKIRVKLLHSGKVRFLADTANIDEVLDERDFTENMTRKTSNQPMLESDYILTGSVRSIRKATKKIHTLYYQITMELVDPESGEILWADEKEIRKVSEKPSFGW